MTTIAEALAAALQHHQAGDLQRAERIYRQILEVDPSQAEALHFLGVIAHQVGRQDLAIDYMKRSLALSPLNEGFHCNLGAAYQAQGRLDEAVACYRQALGLRPDHAQAHNNLGNALADQGKLDEAVACYGRALRLQPDYAEAHNNLAVALQKQDKLEEAEAHARKAVRLKPDYAEARNSLGNAQRARGKLGEAVLNFREALRLAPDHALAHSNLGGVLQLQGKLDEAVASYRQALRCRPDHAEASSNLATALQAQGRLDEAEAHLRQALQFRPDSADACNNLGGVLQLQGELDGALACYRQAHRLAPGSPVAYSNILLCLNYDPRADAGTLSAEHRHWGDLYGAPVAGAGPAPGHDRNPDRRLRVGYVSPDLSWHPIASFLQPILAHHDPGQVEAICYAEVSAPDAMTARLQSLARGWRLTHGLGDAALADLIRADRIDLLVDLAGHTAKSRLRVFAHKPAPVQATWLGYPNTTGLTTVDYRLTDAVADPPGEAAGYTEELIRLPRGFCCYAPPPAAPEVGPLPAGRAGYVTFGSLHNLPRLNAAVLDVWCAILWAVPTARLLIFRHTLQGQVQETLHRGLTGRGIEAGRIDMRHAAEGGGGHLGVYRAIDVSLDTFPWSGHTTACESLWMGVPVVTLRGTRQAGRMVASVLTQVGLTDLIAETPEQYADLAMRLARDPERLAGLRARLREQVRESPLCDGAGFTRSLEAAYREVWQRWCGRA
jgi:predicted O-linked N-acetylglucosamine transferase (SPINDLY family)